jgi:hypothetical protein
MEVSVRIFQDTTDATATEQGTRACFAQMTQMNVTPSPVIVPMESASIPSVHSVAIAPDQDLLDPRVRSTSMNASMGSTTVLMVFVKITPGVLFVTAPGQGLRDPPVTSISMNAPFTQTTVSTDSV